MRRHLGLLYERSVRQVRSLKEREGPEAWSAGEQGGQRFHEGSGGWQVVKHRLGCNVAAQAGEEGLREEVEA